MRLSDEHVRAIGLRVGMEARQEHLAIRMMKAIARSGFLRREVPALAAPFEAILDDEVRHLKLFTACAKRYGVEAARVVDDADLSVVLTYPPHVMLRHIYAVEQMSKFGFRLNIEIHQIVTGDTDAVAMYQAIARDEQRHVRIGRKIHKALLAVPRYREDFRVLQTRHVVEHAYRAAFGDRSFIRRQFGLAPDLGPITIPPWEEPPR
jgi:ribonucleotide reductase beta subunit family protein with ferritin-like domain